MNIVLIAGSPSAPSRSTGVLRRIIELVETSARTELLELHGLPPDGLLFGVESAAINRAREMVTAADAIVVATPVYKAAYSGLLKTFFDYFPEAALRGKTAFPIATGASQAHLLSVDYALKPLLSVLGVSRILSGLYIPNEAATIDGATVTLRDDYDARLRGGVAELLAATPSK